MRLTVAEFPDWSIQSEGVAWLIFQRGAENSVVCSTIWEVERFFDGLRAAPKPQVGQVMFLPPDYQGEKP